MRRESFLRFVALGAVLSIGCSASGSSPSLLIGSDGAGGRPGGGAASFGGEPNVVLRDAGVSRALSAHIENGSGVTVEFVTLSCSNDCADVVAVAKGGFEPYRFNWEDGSTDATRHVCPTATTSYQVTVVDGGQASGELRRAPQTVTAALTANVIRCPDAGPGSDGDAAVVPPGNPGEFCIENPGVEGTPGVTEFGFDLPGWKVCTVTPDVGPSLSSAPPSQGATYLALMDAGGVLNETAETSFCSPLEPGHEVAFSVDVGVSSWGAGPGHLEVWGGSTTCAPAELLWTSPVVNDTNTWHTFCATFTPSKSAAFLVLKPVKEGALGSYLMVDDFVPKATCN